MADDRSDHFQLHELHVDGSLGEKRQSQPASESDANSKPYPLDQPFSDPKHGIEPTENQQMELLDGTEPVIKTGADVSRYLVSLHDAGDPPLTFRGFVLGTGILILNSVITMIYSAKPVELTLSNVFIILVIFVAGYFWSRVFPKPSWVENRPALRW